MYMHIVHPPSAWPAFPVSVYVCMLYVNVHMCGVGVLVGEWLGDRYVVNMCNVMCLCL
jgi:hypothetical protein